jgi:hypothetical protein
MRLITGLLLSISSTLLASTKGKQEPWEYGSLTGGELILSTIRKQK